MYSASSFEGCCKSVYSKFSTEDVLHITSLFPFLLWSAFCFHLEPFGEGKLLL